MLDALLAEARLRWGLDPAAGLQVIASERLIATPLEPSRPALIVPLAALRADEAGQDPPAPLPGRHGPLGDERLGVLGRLYPSDHAIGRFGREDRATIADLVPDDFHAPLYLGPVAAELAVAAPWAMPWVSWRLRQPDGCPWDREQTHESLRNHLLEEAYEVYDALGPGAASPELAGELGDLLLQVVLHAQLAAEEGVFDLTDVWAAIARKIVRRHPHVFGEAEARTASDVNRQWEKIKQGERAEAAATGDGAETPRSALDGISRSLPALAASQEMQERAANLGYDWPSIDGVLDKVREEVGELVEAEDAEARSEELGDLRFVLVNVGRKTDLEVEAALRAANDKFRRRFRRVERLAAERDVALRDLSFEELDAMWDAAKAEERAAAGGRT